MAIIRAIFPSIKPVNGLLQVITVEETSPYFLLKKMVHLEKLRKLYSTMEMASIRIARKNRMCTLLCFLLLKNTWLWLTWALTK